MQLAYKARHRANLKYLQESADLPGNNKEAQTNLLAKHCREFHGGSACEAAQKALRLKNDKQR